MKTYQDFLDEVHTEAEGGIPSTLKWLSDKANNLVIDPDIIIESTKRYAAYIWDEACKAQRTKDISEMSLVETNGKKTDDIGCFYNSEKGSTIQPNVKHIREMPLIHNPFKQ